MKSYYGLICSLPALPGFGEKSPLRANALIQSVYGFEELEELLSAILLEHDIELWQEIESGVAIADEPLMMKKDKVGSLAGVLESISHEGEAESFADSDMVWEAYYQYLFEIADKAGCVFLKKWIAFESMLKNALAVRRSKLKGEVGGRKEVAPDLSDHDLDVRAALEAWESEKDNPYIALREMLKAKWNFVEEHGDWFGFSINEIAAYCVALMILQRLERVEKGAAEIPSV